MIEAMITRIFGLLMCIAGAFLVGNTLLTGAVPTAIFLWVMTGLVLSVGGTMLTSDSFHRESKED